MEIKTCVALFLLVLATNSVASPVTERNEELDNDQEIDFLPLEHQRRDVIPGLAYDGDQPIVDTGLFPNPFFSTLGLYQSIEAMLASMRQRINQILGSLPRVPANETSLFPGFDVDLGKGNTTSVTKIIDGHKVVINETEYHNEGQNGESFFKVRIINIQPEESAESTENPSTPLSKNRETEPVDENLDNEISKHREEYLENFDDKMMNWDHDIDEVDGNRENWSQEWNDVEPVIYEMGNELNPNPVVHDLSNDIYVNKLAEEAGAPIDEDAEFIGEVRQRTPAVVKYEK